MFFFNPTVLPHHADHKTIRVKCLRTVFEAGRPSREGRLTYRLRSLWQKRGGAAPLKLRDLQAGVAYCIRLRTGSGEFVLHYSIYSLIIRRIGPTSYRVVGT